MTTAISYENGGKGILITCSGTVTGADTIRVNAEITQDPHLRYQIWDYTQADDISMSIEEMHELAIQDKKYRSDAQMKRFALVGPAKIINEAFETYEEMSKFAGSSVIKIDSKCFADLQAAREWAGK